MQRAEVFRAAPLQCIEQGLGQVHLKPLNLCAVVDARVSRWRPSDLSFDHRSEVTAAQRSLLLKMRSQKQGEGV